MVRTFETREEGFETSEREPLVVRLHGGGWCLEHAGGFMAALKVRTLENILEQLLLQYILRSPSSTPLIPDPQMFSSARTTTIAS